MNKAIPTTLFLTLLCSVLFAQRTPECFDVSLGSFYTSPVADGIVLDDGGYFILAEEDYYYSGYDPYGFLMRYDRQHNLIWRKNLGQTYGRPFKLFKGPNRTVYCATGSEVTKYGENGGALLKFSPANGHSADFVQEDASGNIMVSGIYYDYPTAKYSMALSSFSPAGTARWPSALLPPSAAGTYMNSEYMKVFADGSVLIAAQTESKQINYGKVRTDGTTAFNLKIDPLTFRIDLTSAAVATDGFYFMVTHTKSDYTTEAYLYKTDLNGAITRTTKIATAYNTSVAGSILIVDNVNPIISYNSSNAPSYSSNRGTVTKLTSTGATTWAYNQNTYWLPSNIQSDAAGNIYVADYSGVIKLTSTGSLADQVATPSTLYVCSVTSSGDIYMLNDYYATDCFLSTLKNCTAIGITTNIAAKAVCPGAATDLQFVASGKELSYQWMKDGNVVFDDDRTTGTKTSKIAISNFSASDAGDYTCVATDNCGKTVTSAVAKLTLVAQPLTITTQPASKLVCAATATTFAVVATGGTNIKYQWTKNGTNMTDGGNASGTKTSTLSLTSVTSADAATYACTVVNDCNTPVVSVNATLTIAPGTAISKQPVAQSSGEGVEVLFSLEASGTGLTYQWKKNGTNVTNGTKYAGATSSVLTIKGVACGDAGSYSCTVSATCGTPVNSNAVALTVASDVVINRNPTAQKKCTGETATMVVQATGANLTYSWSKGSTVLSDAGHYSGTKTSVLTITGVSSADVGSYSCVVSGGCSITRTSLSAALELTTAPVIVSQSPGQTICTGETTKLSVTLGDGNYTYQWLKNNSALTSSANLTGVSSASLFITNTAASDAGTYTCKVTGCGGQSTTSSAIVIATTTSVTINTQPVATSFCEGGDFSLAVSTTGTGATYQWTKDGVALTDNTHITGAKSNTLKITDADASLHQGYYSCKVQGGCGSAIASNIVLVLGNPTPDLYLLKNIDCFQFMEGIEAELIGDHENLTGTFKVYRENNSTPLNGFQSIVDAGNYEIVKTTGANCSNTLQITIDCIITGLEEGPAEFTVTPNPTRGTVALTTAKNFVSYHVVNVIGTQLLQGNITQSDQNIDMKHLPDGLYLFVIKAQDGSKKVQKLILER